MPKERSTIKKDVQLTFSVCIFLQIELLDRLEKGIIARQGMKINTSCQGRVKQKFSILNRVGVKPIDVLSTI